MTAPTRQELLRQFRLVLMQADWLESFGFNAIAERTEAARSMAIASAWLSSKLVDDYSK